MSTIRIKLSVMMFLEFFIWGAWFVTGNLFSNKFTFRFRGSICFLNSVVGAIIAPFIIGLIADRYFNAEKILLHIAGALLMYQMYHSE
jgi:hypothetical protein